MTLSPSRRLRAKYRVRSVSRYALKRTTWEVEMGDEMLKMWTSGLSITAISRETGRSVEEVEDTLRESLRALDDRLAGGDDGGSD